MKFTTWSLTVALPVVSTTYFIVCVVTALDAKIAQISNPNLLINSDFRNPINQRGASSYSGLGNYTIDRWRLLTNTAILTVNQNSITLNGSFSQYIEMPLIEGDYTMSISINGVVYRSTINNFKGAWVPKEIGENNNTWALAYTNNCLRLEYYPQVEVNIEWIKLEQGSIATPFVPRSYGEELAMCQRYDWSYTGNFMVGRARYAGTASYYNGIMFPVEMRATPTCKITAVTGTDSTSNDETEMYSVCNTKAIGFLYKSGINETRLEIMSIIADAEIY